MTYGRKYNTDMDLKEVERKQMLQFRNSTYQCEGSLLGDEEKPCTELLEDRVEPGTELV